MLEKVKQFMPLIRRRQWFVENIQMTNTIIKKSQNERPRVVGDDTQNLLLQFSFNDIYIIKCQPAVDTKHLLVNHGIYNFV